MSDKKKIIESYSHGLLSKSEYISMLSRVNGDGDFVKKTVGVFDGSLLLTRFDLKQLSLYFDKFYIVDLENWLSGDLFNTVENSYLGNKEELNWLIDNEIINPIKMPSDEELISNFSNNSEYARLVSLFNGDMFNNVIERKDKGSDDYQIQLVKVIHRMSIYKARLICSMLNKRVENDSYPVIDNLNDLSELTEGIPKAHVVNVLLKKIPLPSKTTPWQDIQEFREDSDSKEKYQRVKGWLNKISTKELSTKEIYDEIECLMAEYETHMKIHKIKVDHGFLKTSVISSIEIVENILKLNWADVAKKTLALGGKNISLLEAEMGAPGRELSYFVKLHEEFR